MPNDMVETLGKLVTYSIISLAGLTMLYKLLIPTKSIDKTFMTKTKKRAIKKLKHLFYDIKLIDFDNLKVVKLCQKNEQGENNSSSTTSNTLIKKEKLQKMNKYLENVIKTSSFKEDGQINCQNNSNNQVDSNNINNDNQNSHRKGKLDEYDDEKPHKHQYHLKKEKKLDKRDRVFYQLFQNVSKMYSKEDINNQN